MKEPIDPVESAEPVEPRKASEIVVSLEHKVDLILKSLQNYNFKLNLVLQEINKVNGTLALLMEEDPENKGKEPEPIIEEIKADADPIGVRRTARPETVNKFPSIPPSEKKVPVHQKVLDPNGKIVFLADVEVVTSDKNLILKTRTTAAGKWVGSLPPGQYTLFILKRETNNRKRLEFTRTITVEASDVPVELDPAQLA